MNRLLACAAVLALLSACTPNEPETPPPDTQKPAPVLSIEKSAFEARPSLLLADGQEKSTLTVTARTADGEPIADLPVTLLVSGQDNLLEPATANTNAAGQAIFTLRSTLAEPKRVTATIAGQQFPRHLDLEFFPGPVTRVGFRVPPSTVRAGQPMAPAVVIDLHDAQGNRVTNIAKELTLALGSNPGNATLGGKLSAMSTGGSVSFDDLTIDKAGSGYTLVASGEGLEPTSSNPFSVTAGAPERLLFQVEPASSAAGQPIAPAIEVAFADALGNRVEDVTGDVTIAIASGPAGAKLSGLATVAATKGVARFSNLSLDKLGDYTLAATATGFAGATSATFTIRAGAARALRFTTQPSNVTVRSPFTVAVAVEDAGGNRVTDATSTVTLTLSGSGPLNGTTSVTASAGVATFAGLTLEKDGTGFQLEATAPGLDLALTQPFAVTDNLPPSAISDLRVTGEFGTSLTLAWTEVGDDGLLGQAASYEVRYSTSALNAGNFASAPISDLGVPKAPQQPETFTVDGLSPNTLYFVGLKVADGAGNSVLAFTSGRTTLCPRGYAGASCDVCATGFRQTSPGVCEDYCTNNDPCNPPPAASCGGTNGNSVLTWPATRSCTPTTTAPFFECQAPTVTDCGATNRLCHDAQCVADPCAGVTCPGAPPTCAADGITLNTSGAVCERVVVNGALQAQCVQGSPTQTDCSLTGKVCHAGSCQTASAPAPGELVISEILYAPTSAPFGQWFEVQNVSGKLLELAGLKVELVGGDSFALPSGTPVRLEAGEAFVFGYSADQGSNGGVEVDYQWGASRPGFRLDVTKHLRLSIDAGATVIESLDYGSVTPAMPVGTAANLSSAVMAPGANQRSWYWCAATASLPGGDRGTPGAPNASCGIAPSAPIDFCVLQHPKDAGVVDGTTPFTAFGRFFEPGVTNRNPAGNDFYPRVVAQLGYGPKPSAGQADPATWTWVSAEFNGSYVDNDATTDNDEVQASFTPPASGDYLFGYRFALRDPASGALSPYVYCDRNGIAATPSAGSYGTVTFFSGGTGIATARAQPDGVGLNIPITGAVVTYLKPALGNDPSGFFVQGAPGGPALFVAVHPTAVAPAAAKGDRVDFVVTAMATKDGNREVAALVNYARVGQGGSVGALAQNVSAANDLFTALDSYEGELLRLSGTFSSSFSSAGTGFVSAPIETAGISGEPNLRVRMPSALRDQLDLTEGCQVTLSDVPMWRYYVQAQPSLWYASDVTVSSCPAPKVVSATPTSPTEVVVTFDRQIFPNSVLPNGSQFGILPALAVTGAIANGTHKVTLTTGRQASATLYTLTVANSVKDLYGRGPVSPNHTATFSGVANVCTPSRVVISQVYGGGGNSGAIYSNDFIELHNRSSQTVALGGWSLQYGSATGTAGWQVWPLPASATIGPGGYYLVQLASGGSNGIPLPASDGTSSLNMAGSNGKVALVDSTVALSGACPTFGVIDQVGYGSANCFEGTAPAPALTSATAAIRASSGCIDSTDNGFDFGAAEPNPRSSASSPVQCGCD